jgi:hypothetical protein
MIRDVKRLFIVAVFVLVGCDRGARKDLPQSNQDVIDGNADVYLFPDKFPNLVHRCGDKGLGIWSTTDRWVWIIFNDPTCPGSEGEMVVLDNIPGAQAP